VNKIFEYALRFTGNTADAKRQIEDLKKQTTALGAEIKQIGKSDAGSDGFGKQVKETEKDLQRYSDTSAKTALSQKQLSAAMRGVPAQFTDIITSLQGGQAPLTVLLQQGGQLKDMFGGMGGAAKALGGYVAGLINPLTIATAAAAAMAYAYYQGWDESNKLAKSLVFTGNAAASNVSGLYKMADAVASATGASKGASAEAVEAAVYAGKITSEMIGNVSEAALRLQRTGGAAMAETVKQFSELGKSPVEASLKLTDQYNYLTAEVYRQIKALMDEGREREAGALAQKAYADAANSMADDLEKNLSGIEKAWRKVKDEAGKAWDSMLGGGRKKSVKEQLAEVENQIAVAEKINQAKSSSAGVVPKSSFAGYGENLPQLEQERTRLKALVDEQEKVTEAKTKQNVEEQAGIKFLQLREKYLSDEKRLQREIAVIRQTGKEAGKSDKEIADAVAEAKAKKAKKDNSGDLRSALMAETKASAEAEMKILQQHFSEAGEAYKRAYDQRLISVRDFYTAQAFVQDQALAAQEAAVRKELDQAESGKENAKGRADIARATAEITRLEGELTVITEKRGQVATTANAKTESTLKTLKDKLDDLRQKMAETMGDASPEQIGEAVSKRYKDLLADAKLNAADVPGGVDLVEKMINVETAKDRLTQIQTAWQRTMGTLSAEEQRINILKENGLYSELEARTQILQLQRDAGVLLQEQIPALDQLAEKYPHLATQIAEMRNQWLRLSSVTDEWTSTFNGAAKSALAGFFTDATSRSKSFGQAAMDALNAIRNKMVSLAAEHLADEIFKTSGSSSSGGGLFGMLGGLFGGLFGGSSASAGTSSVPGFGGSGLGNGIVLRHLGGLIGSGGGLVRSGLSFSPDQIARAPRFHQGGLIGGEQLLVGKVGEEVLTEDDPRHIKNGGGMAPEIHIHEATGARVADVKSSTSNGRSSIEIFLEQADGYLARNLVKGQGQLTNAMETVGALSRGRSSRGG